MRRRTSEPYTVLIARPGKEPIVFCMQPVVIWVALTLLLMLIATNLYFLLFRNRASSKQVSTELQQVSGLYDKLSSTKQVLSEK